MGDTLEASPPVVGLEYSETSLKLETCYICYLGGAVPPLGWWRQHVSARVQVEPFLSHDIKFPECNYLTGWNYFKEK